MSNSWRRSQKLGLKFHECQRVFQWNSQTKPAPSNCPCTKKESTCTPEDNFGASIPFLQGNYFWQVQVDLIRNSALLSGLIAAVRRWRCRPRGRFLRRVATRLVGSWGLSSWEGPTLGGRNEQKLPPSNKDTPWSKWCASDLDVSVCQLRMGFIATPKTSSLCAPFRDFTRRPPGSPPAPKKTKFREF